MPIMTAVQRRCSRQQLGLDRRPHRGSRTSRGSHACWSMAPGDELISAVLAGAKPRDRPARHGLRPRLDNRVHTTTATPWSDRSGTSATARRDARRRAVDVEVIWHGVRRRADYELDACEPLIDDRRRHLHQDVGCGRSLLHLLAADIVGPSAWRGAPRRVVAQAGPHYDLKYPITAVLLAAARIASTVVVVVLPFVPMIPISVIARAGSPVSSISSPSARAPDGDHVASFVRRRAYAFAASSSRSTTTMTAPRSIAVLHERVLPVSSSAHDEPRPPGST